MLSAVVAAAHLEFACAVSRELSGSARVCLQGVSFTAPLLVPSQDVQVVTRLKLSVWGCLVMCERVPLSFPGCATK